jgi:CubicO group peptidase (beta-lactamase class C family)
VTAVPVRGQLPDHVVEALDRRLATAQRTHRLPSVVAAVFGRDGGWVGGAGLVDDAPPTPDTQYRIGSITKTVVAVAVLRLRDAGALDLDDRVHDHLAGGDVIADHPVGRATIAQLLQHAAGATAETGGGWWERTQGGDLASLLADVAARPAAGSAGRRFHYSNVGFGLLGGVLEHHHDQSWVDVVTADLLLPLGMTRTSPRPVAPAAPGLAVHPWTGQVLAEPEHDAGAMAPAGQLWASIDDLVRWGRFLGGDVDGADGPLLDRATWVEACLPSVVAHTPGDRWTTAHGLGVQVFNADGTVRIGHGGSMPGFLAGVRCAPSSGVGVALLTNTTAGLDPTLQGDLLALAGPHLETATPWRPSAPLEGVEELAGVWFWGPRPHLVTATPEGLHLGTMDGLGRASRFVPDGDGWRGIEGYYAGEPLRVGRGPGGDAVRLVLAGSFILTRTPYDPDPAADVPGGVDPSGWR